MKQLASRITIVKSLAERVAAVRKERGLSQIALAGLAKVSPGTIGNVESGARRAPRELVAIADALGVDPRWLTTGKGRRDVAAPGTALVAEETKVDYGRGGNVEEIAPRRRVPLLSWIQAGELGDAVEPYPADQAEEWVDVYETRCSDQTFALRVTGDSMTAPFGDSFPEGTIIVVDPVRCADPGDYVVAKDVSTQRATFKKLTTDGGRWFLKPLNPTYPIVEIDDPGLRVIGRVVESFLRRKL